MTTQAKDTKLTGLTACKCRVGPEWSGSPNPANPDNEWLCDECGRVIDAREGSEP
jgi:hypothetical protein